MTKPTQDLCFDIDANPKLRDPLKRHRGDTFIALFVSWFYISVPVCLIESQWLMWKHTHTCVAIRIHAFLKMCMCILLINHNE